MTKTATRTDLRLYGYHAKTCSYGHGTGAYPREFVIAPEQYARNQLSYYYYYYTYETQTHAPLTARAPTAAPAPALTLHAGPGTGLALSLKARKVGAVPDKPHRNGDEAARAQRTMQTGLRRRDA